MNTTVQAETPGDIFESTVRHRHLVRAKLELSTAMSDRKRERLTKITPGAHRRNLSPQFTVVTHRRNSSQYHHYTNRRNSSQRQTDPLCVKLLKYKQIHIANTNT